MESRPTEKNARETEGFGSRPTNVRDTTKGSAKGISRETEGFGARPTDVRDTTSPPKSPRNNDNLADVIKKDLLTAIKTIRNIADSEDGVKADDLLPLRAAIKAARDVSCEMISVSSFDNSDYIVVEKLKHTRSRLCD